MEINYSKEQLDLLEERFDFLKGVRNATVFATIVFFLIFAFGFVAIDLGWALLGVIILFVMLLPVFMSLFAVIMMNKFFSSLKKHKVSITEVGCQAWVREEDNRMWHKITTYSNEEFYYFTEDPFKEIKAGEKLHVLKYDSGLCIPMAFDPIEQPQPTIDEEKEDKQSEMSEMTN